MSPVTFEQPSQCRPKKDSITSVSDMTCDELRKLIREEITSISQSELPKIIKDEEFRKMIRNETKDSIRAEIGDRLDTIETTLNTMQNIQTTIDGLETAMEFTSRRMDDFEKSALPALTQHVERQKWENNGWIQNTGLQPMSLEAKTGIWTRVNRNNQTEKSIIDYILPTPQVAKQRKSIIIDETGNLRMKGRKESDHNTITMETKCQTRKALEKRQIWRTNNEEAWEDFNKEMQNTPEEVTKDYNKFEKFLNKTMAQQLGKITITPGKKRKITNPEIKRPRQYKKQAKKKHGESIHGRK